MPQTSLPNYHFLLIASNLGAEWFFDAARAYWEQFRPTVISDLPLVSLISDEFSVAVTTIARRDRVAQIGVELAKIAPEALFDPVVFDFLEDAQQALDERARLNQPFGVPLIPTETPTPGPTSQPVYPTPGPIGIPGFVTQTSTPTPTPGLPDQANIESDGTPQVPLFPTPGPITGSSEG
ncbi:MAG: hypothetical protein K8J31_29165 [Anaerolineae bacterium]|nr:hypothetical protein [Anaerolineae bacterium]